METTINQRLRLVVDYLIQAGRVKNDAAFGREIEKNRSQMSCMLKGTQAISWATASKIGNTFPEIDNNWLMTGEGDMLRAVAPVDQAAPVSETPAGSGDDLEAMYRNLASENADLKIRLARALKRLAEFGVPKC